MGQKSVFEGFSVISLIRHVVLLGSRVQCDGQVHSVFVLPCIGGTRRQEIMLRAVGIIVNKVGLTADRFCHQSFLYAQLPAFADLHFRKVGGMDSLIHIIGKIQIRICGIVYVTKRERHDFACGGKNTSRQSQVRVIVIDISRTCSAGRLCLIAIIAFQADDI